MIIISSFDRSPEQSKNTPRPPVPTGLIRKEEKTIPTSPGSFTGNRLHLLHQILHFGVEHVGNTDAFVHTDLPAACG